MYLNPLSNRLAYVWKSVAILCALNDVDDLAYSFLVLSSLTAMEDCKTLL
jgi:hypothetical protein